MMQIKLNGKSKTFEDELTVLQLLEHLEQNPQRVAVELNQEIIKKDQYDSLRLKDGDEVEVLQFVGGGA